MDDMMRFGGGSSESSMQPVILLILILAIVAILTIPKRSIIIPFILATCLTTFGQQVNIGGAHFFMMRILILVGWVRIARESGLAGSGLAAGLTRIDRVFLVWAVCRAVATYLEFFQSQALINQVGFLLDSIGCYMLCRILIRDRRDITTVIRAFAIVSIVLSITMIGEIFSGRNLFQYLANQSIISIREGKIRARGSFVGPIQAGSFAANLICLMFWLRGQSGSRLLGTMGLLGAFVMVITSRSSTPLLTLLGALAALLCYPLRSYTRIFRWSAAALLATLHLTMKAPVWMLINRVDLIGGNSGYHRAMLIDVFVHRFSEWWLIGVRSTAGWGWDMWDQANQFVAEGFSGGLATFVCFVLLVGWSLGSLGTARRKLVDDEEQEWLLWILGSTLCAYLVSFFGISFSDQTVIAWYATLAMAVAASVSRRSDPQASSANSTRVTQESELNARWGWGVNRSPWRSSTTEAPMAKP